MPTHLAIFDFDGTLFKSPDQPAGWKSAWWQNSDSLDPPCIPERPGSEWWVASMVKTARKLQAAPNTRTVLLTGRSDKFRSRVRDLLRQQSINFDELHLSLGGTTLAFKLKTIGDLLKRFPDIRTVDIWDDRPEHTPAFRDLLAKHDVRFGVHDVAAATKDAECPAEESWGYGTGRPLFSISSQLSAWSLQEAEPAPAGGTETPERYRKRTGRCPPGLRWNGKSCELDILKNKTPPSEQPDAKPAKPPKAPKKPKTPKEPKAPTEPKTPTEPTEPKAPSKRKTAPKHVSFKDYVGKKWGETKKTLKNLPSVLKKLPRRTAKWLKGAGASTQAFFTSKEHRNAAVRAVGQTLREAPADLYGKAVKVAKHEVHEFKHAGKALKKIAKKENLTKKDWDAISTVTKHIAITVAAAAATASGIGIVGAIGKGLAKNYAAKVAGESMKQIQTGEELSHLTHFFEAAGDDEEARTDRAMQYVAQVVANELAKELERGVPDEDLVQIATHAADEPGAAEAREEAWLRIRPSLSIGSLVQEWALHEQPPTPGKEHPDKYKRRVGRCPPGYRVNYENGSCEKADISVPEPFDTKAAVEPAPEEPRKAAPKDDKPKLADPKTGKLVSPMSAKQAAEFAVQADASPTEFREKIKTDPAALGRAAAADPSIVDAVKGMLTFEPKWTKGPLSEKELAVIRELAKKYGFDSERVEHQFDLSEPEALDDETLGKIGHTDVGQVTSAEDAANRMKKKAARQAQDLAKVRGDKEAETNELVDAAVEEAGAFFGELVGMFAAGSLLDAPLLLFLPAGPVFVGGSSLALVARALGVTPEIRKAVASVRS
jgi:hypothetical protein